MIAIQSEMTHPNVKSKYIYAETRSKAEIYSEPVPVSGILDILIKTPVLTWVLIPITISKITPTLRRLKRVKEEISKLKKEEPEVIRLVEKLKKGKPLDNVDKWNLKEISEASGWNVEDIKEELINLDKDPSEREERYWQLFNKYKEEAKKFKEQGNDTQAAEKLWGAITALIKAYAAKIGVPVRHWSMGKLDEIIHNNIPVHLRSQFRELFDTGSKLHEHFYEKHLSQEGFNVRWDKCINLIENLIKNIHSK